MQHILRKQIIHIHLKHQFLLLKLIMLDPKKHSNYSDSMFMDQVNSNHNILHHWHNIDKVHNNLLCLRQLKIFH